MADDQATTTPWRDRRAFLVAITATAGWLDALAFLHLGKVFNSFMTGNVLFVGFGIGEGDGGLVVRAGAALTAFVLGSFIGARIVGSRLTAEAEREPLTRALSLVAGLLTAFAMLWLATGAPAEQPVVQVVLLALGAAAMGLQAAVSLALKIPNIATVALTATIAQLAALAGWRRREGVVAPDVPAPALMGAMILTYFAAALIVALAPDWRILSLGPLVLLAFGVGTPRAAPASRRHP